LFEEIPKKLEAPEGLKPAAVLVALVGESLLFTVRSSTLSHHRGQISFPGGRLEPGEGPLEAALREAEEEVGLVSALVTPLGALSPVLSPAGFWVLPVVGRVGEGFVPRPNPAEVAEVFLAPIEELKRVQAWPEWRKGRYVWHYPFRGRDIWGVTGNILREFLARLRP